jgi:DNA-binding NarL/FixJ family response regulator
MTIRVLIADDHPIFVTGLRATFDDVGDIDVVAAVEDGQAAVDATADLHPDVLLMDLRMPGLNGIEATRRITATSNPVAVIVLTMFDDDESVFAAMTAGARGYLVKGARQERIVDAVRAVAAGEIIFGKAVAQQVLALFTAGRQDRRAGGPFPTLTHREAEVLSLIAAGHNNRRIAGELYLSEKTVRNHVSAIFAKLHVTDRAQAIVRAREAGMS